MAKSKKAFRKMSGVMGPASVVELETCGRCFAPADWRKQFAHFRSHIIDLGAQVEELRAAQPMTSDERKDVDRRMTEHRIMQAAEASIRRWILDNKQTDIDAGKHNNKTLDQIVIAYMKGQA